MPKYRGPKDQFKEELEAARSPEPTPDELEILIESPFEVVGIAVAEHPNTKPFTLAELVPLSLQSPSDLDLAAALARNDNTPDYALRRLGQVVDMCMDSLPVHEKCFEICVAMCCHANTPLEVIRILLAPDRGPMELRKVVARETRRRDVLRLLGTDRSATVRNQALQTFRSIDHKGKDD